MRRFSLVLIILILFASCRKSHQLQQPAFSKAGVVKYASGLQIEHHQGFSIVRINNPWPDAEKVYTYVLKKRSGAVPDSLSIYPTINVPVNSIITTSTTHIPSLEMLGVENTLIGFPNLNYISSPKVRKRIDAGKIRELGSNQNLNTEIAIDLAPDVLIGFGIDNNNPSLDNLQKSGIKVVLNGDWNEQTPLGKAEWLKLFGALYDQNEKADSIFSSIEKEYLTVKSIAAKIETKPTVLAGSVYENHWYLPQGNSWGAILIKDGGGEYLWESSQGTGSLSLPTEEVLVKAKDADFWIGPGQFTSRKEMLASSQHYAEFKAFKNNRIYSFSSKKGATGGVLYYELAPNRPDIVLKDILRILHPEAIPGHELYFFEKVE